MAHEPLPDGPAHDEAPTHVAHGHGFRPGAATAEAAHEAADLAAAAAADAEHADLLGAEADARHAFGARDVDATSTGCREARVQISIFFKFVSSVKHDLVLN